ncbi:MAG: amidohydrolase, partial [Terracidiphilus sp.]
MRSSGLLLAIMLASASLCRAQNAPSAVSSAKQPHRETLTAPDMILFDGVIYTGVGFTEGKPQAVQAMAIANGKVLAVGSDDAIKRLAGPGTVLRDLDSMHTDTVVFPGFNDAHTHLGSAGQTKIHLDLTGVESLDSMLAKVKAFTEAAPPGHWITGGNWDHTLWTNKRLPTRQDLDKVTGGRPAFLDRIDGHIAIANTAALKAAGLTSATKPPQGGSIDLDANGQPTGILRESAKALVQNVIPPPTSEERQRGDHLAIDDAVAHGVTSVQDFSDWQDFLVFEEMEKESKLKVRITEWLPFRAPLPDILVMRAHHDQQDPMLHTGMLKGFMDGSLGSHTAAMKQPYADDTGNTGLPQYTQSELNAVAKERAQAGFQIGFHAIGDKAAAMALEAFEQADVTSAARDRIEHAQVVDPADFPRFKQLGVIASMQPNHLLTDMNWAEDRLGSKRAAYSYAWKAFLDAGVPLAFGT